MDDRALYSEDALPPLVRATRLQQHTELDYMLATPPSTEDCQAAFLEAAARGYDGTLNKIMAAMPATIVSLIHARDAEGLTSLMIASRGGFDICVMRLLEHRARTQVTDWPCRTPCTLRTLVLPRLVRHTSSSTGLRHTHALSP